MWTILFLSHMLVISQICVNHIMGTSIPVTGISIMVLCADAIIVCGVSKTCLGQYLEAIGVARVELRRMQISLHRMDALLTYSDQSMEWEKSVDELYSDQRVEWEKSVEDLRHKHLQIGIVYDGRGLNYLKSIYFCWIAHLELKYTTNYLLKQGHTLLHPQYQLRGTMDFYRTKVLDFIEDMGADSGLLGIWGMGGLGKSSLLKLISDSRSEYDNNASLKVLFVRADIGCTVGQVQEAIAVSMGLLVTGDEASQAELIHDHLTDKNFLLLLDDLWGYLDLKAVGIPSPLGTVVVVSRQGQRSVPQKRRKVVLTTRRPDVCIQMGCHDKTIPMECLDEEDTWKLFHKGWPVPVVANRVDGFATERDKLLSDEVVEARPHTDVIQQQRQDRLPEMMSSFEKVRYFIEDKDARSTLLGFWGMRGMGKTYLLRLVRDFYTRNHPCFDHVLFVGAGTGCVMNNVQNAIAINLNMDLAMMSSSDELSRAMHIFAYLEHKSYLFLLDDIREPLNWWAIGLPIFTRRQQKIILATRSQAACTLMVGQARNTIEVRRLEEDDAWKLFRAKVGLGIIDDHPQVRHLAEQMVSLCEGLPLALCSLGRAMSSKRDPREWRTAYSQLRQFRDVVGLKPCEIDDKMALLL